MTTVLGQVEPDEAPPPLVVLSRDGALAESRVETSQGDDADAPKRFVAVVDSPHRISTRPTLNRRPQLVAQSNDPTPPAELFAGGDPLTL